jgi:hypothetical protein
MAIVRGFAATAMFVGLAVIAAGTAWADDPASMNGTYTETSTSPSGRATTNDWSVNPCPDQLEGCIYVKAGAGGSQAHLIDGQWVMDSMGNLMCPDGTFHQYVTNTHITWDPNTLTGTSQITYNAPACGQPAGYVQTNQISLKKSS